MASGPNPPMMMLLLPDVIVSWPPRAPGPLTMEAMSLAPGWLRFTTPLSPRVMLRVPPPGVSGCPAPPPRLAFSPPRLSITSRAPVSGVVSVVNTLVTVVTSPPRASSAPVRLTSVVAQDRVHAAAQRDGVGAEAADHDVVAAERDRVVVAQRAGPGHDREDVVGVHAHLVQVHHA